MKTVFWVLVAFLVGGLAGWLFWPRLVLPPELPPVPRVPAPPAAPEPPPPKPLPVSVPAAAPERNAAPPEEGIAAFGRALADLQEALADEAWEAGFDAVARAAGIRIEDPSVADARRRLAGAAEAALRRCHRAAATPLPGDGIEADDPAFGAFDALDAFLSGLPGRDPLFAPLVPQDLPLLRREMSFLRARAEALSRDREGDWPAAAAAYARALSLADEMSDTTLADGRDFTARCARGRAIAATGRLEAAAAEYREALAGGRRHPRAEAEWAALEARIASERREAAARAAAEAAAALAAAERAVSDGAWTDALRLLEPLRPPADAVLSPDQRARADRLHRTARLGSSTPHGMAFVPAGPFVMGADDGEDRERPARRLHADDFYIDLREVTNREYRVFLDWMREHKDHRRCPPGEEPDKDHTPAYWDDAAWGGDDRPVVGVDWYDAAAYAAWAGKRLPTEAEWEKAAGWDAASGRVRRYPWGDRFDVSRLHADDSRPAPVGSRPAGASPCGCLDMAGSVFEWTADRARAYPGAAPLGDPFDGDVWRVIRGGIWPPDAPRVYARVSYRQFALPERRETGIGFRCAKTAALQGP